MSKPINYTSLLIIMINSEGIIRFITKPMASVLGYSILELVGKNVIDVLISPEGRKKAIDEIEGLQKSNKNKYAEFETFLQTKSQGTLDLRLKLVRLKDNFLNTQNIALIGDTMMHEKVINQALQASKSNMKELYELANELIIIFNSSQRIIFANKACTSKVGPLSFESEESLYIGDYFSKEASEIVLDAVSNLSSTNSIESVSLSVKSKLTGKTHHLKGYVTADAINDRSFIYQCILNDVTEEIRAEKVKNLYYNVSSQIVENANLQAIYRNIHNELKEVIECTNLYIALYNPEEKDETIVFPYFIDEEGKEDKSNVVRPVSNGITEYSIEQGKPLILSKKELIKLNKKNTISILGSMPEHWIGVPLTISGRVIGVLAIQSYSPDIEYTNKDLELLDFASSQIALAIEMARTREELKNQTARLNAIFESSSHLIWSVNRDLEVTSFNKNYFEANFINYDANPQIQEVDKTKPKTFKSFWIDKYKRAFKGEKLQFEIKLKDDNNNDIWKEIYLNPIYTGINKIEEVSGIAHDVTQKKQSELALLKSEEKFRNIFESFQDLYFRCDTNGNIIMVSPSVYELTGYRPVEVIGKHIDDYYLYNPRVKKILKELRNEKNLKNVEVSIVKHNGDVRQCICNIRMVQNNKNEPFEIEGVVRDITQLKITNQQLIEANEIAENSLRVKE